MIDSSIGVLVVKDFARRDTVRLFNDDGSLWYKFTFYYDDSDGKWDYPNDEFRPRAFNPDNFLLGLDVVAKTPQDFTVVVNGESGLQKRIKKASFLRLLSWDQYVLSQFSIGFDAKENPLRVSPRADAKAIPFVREADYYPERVEGEWLRVKWGPERAEHHGWIRWRSGHSLIVSLYPYP